MNEWKLFPAKRRVRSIKFVVWVGVFVVLIKALYRRSASIFAGALLRFDDIFLHRKVRPQSLQPHDVVCCLYIVIYILSSPLSCLQVSSACYTGATGAITTINY